MVLQEIIKLLILELMRILKTFNHQLNKKKADKVLNGLQLKMLMDTGVYQKQLIMVHMLITKTNTSTIMD